MIRYKFSVFIFLVEFCESQRRMGIIAYKCRVFTTQSRKSITRKIQQNCAIKMFEGDISLSSKLIDVQQTLI
jgi:hypothetical protein